MFIIHMMGFAERDRIAYFTTLQDSLDKANKVNLRQTSIRFIANLFIFALAGLPLIGIYFSSNGHSLSDILSKTGLRRI